MKESIKLDLKQLDVLRCLLEVTKGNQDLLLTITEEVSEINKNTDEVEALLTSILSEIYEQRVYLKTTLDSFLDTYTSNSGKFLNALNELKGLLEAEEGESAESEGNNQAINSHLEEIKVLLGKISRKEVPLDSVTDELKKINSLISTDISDKVKEGVAKLTEISEAAVANHARLVTIIDKHDTLIEDIEQGNLTLGALRDLSNTFKEEVVTKLGELKSSLGTENSELSGKLSTIIEKTEGLNSLLTDKLTSLITETEDINEVLKEYLTTVSTNIGRTNTLLTEKLDPILESISSIETNTGGISNSFSSLETLIKEQVLLLKEKAPTTYKQEVLDSTTKVLERVKALTLTVISGEVEVIIDGGTPITYPLGNSEEDIVRGFSFDLEKAVPTVNIQADGEVYITYVTEDE